MPSAVTFIKDGRVRGLAVAASSRMEELPDLPTTAEAGLPGYTIEFWYGAFTTGGTPQAMVDRLNAEVNKAVAQPDVAAKLKSLGVEPRSGSAADFKARYHREIREWGQVAAKAGFKKQ